MDQGLTTRAKEKFVQDQQFRNWYDKTTGLYGDSETYDITIYDVSPLIIERQPDKRLSAYVNHGQSSPLLPESGYPEIVTYNNIKELKVKARATRTSHTITAKAYGRASGQLNFFTITVPKNM